MQGILVWLLAVPLAGALIGAVLPSEKFARSWALLVSLLTAAVGGIMLWGFDYANGAALQFPISPEALRLIDVGFTFSLAADSISLWLVALTAFLMPLAIASSWESIVQRRKEYYAWMLLLEFAMLGVFVARDLLLFYIFFELTLIPMFFIIGIWGGAERQFAALKFFLFTFSASVLTFAGVVYIGLWAGPDGRASFFIDDVVRAAQSGLSPNARYWVFLAMLAGFAVKIPLFPVHTWLPLAHTEAPTAGSVILAGVLLKLGTYGMLRIALPIGMPDALASLTPFLGALCLVGVVYTALVAWVQKDIKKLVAYSSVSHLAYCVLGLLALNQAGIQGSILYMINHGLSTGALFLVVGMIYDRYHTRDISQLSGLARRMPKLTFFLLVFTFASVGLPGLNGFASEFLTILGAFTSTHLGKFYGAVAALGIILGAIYMLHMVACVMFGPLKTPAPALNSGHNEHGHEPGDIGAREIAILVPLVIAIVLIGVAPNLILRSLQAPVQQLISPSSSVAIVQHAAAVPMVATLDK